MSVFEVRGCNCIDWPCCGCAGTEVYTGADAVKAYERDKALGLTADCREDYDASEDAPDEYYERMRAELNKEIKVNGCPYFSYGDCQNADGTKMEDSDGCEGKACEEAISVWIEESEEAEIIESENYYDMCD